MAISMMSTDGGHVHSIDFLRGIPDSTWAPVERDHSGEAHVSEAAYKRTE